MKADKLASFRLNGELWEQFQDIAKNKNTTATALLIGYIQSVVNTGNVVATPQSIQPSIDNFPKLSIQDINNCIVDKFITAIQGIITTSIQDIDTAVKKLIDDALEDGEIGEAIAKSYAAMMGNFNELLHQMEELKAAIPPAVAPSPQSPVTNHQSPVTSHQSPDTSLQLPVPSHQSPDTSPQSPVTSSQSPITSPQLELIELLGIGDLISAPMSADIIKLNGIAEKIKTHRQKLEELLNQKIDMKCNVVRQLGQILKIAGFRVEGSEKRGYFVKG